MRRDSSLAKKLDERGGERQPRRERDAKHASVKNEREKLWKMIKAPEGVLIQFFREFDPGSGRTLAACLTHASRTEILRNAASAK